MKNDKIIKQDDMTSEKHEINVTEHAILRYLERIKGINMQEVVDEIINDEHQKIVDDFGDCRIKTKDGFKLVVVNNTIVTILYNDDEAVHLMKQRKKERPKGYRMELDDDYRNDENYNLRCQGGARGYTKRKKKSKMNKRNERGMR